MPNSGVILGALDGANETVPIDGAGAAAGNTSASWDRQVGAAPGKPTPSVRALNYLKLHHVCEAVM